MSAGFLFPDVPNEDIRAVCLSLPADIPGLIRIGSPWIFLGRTGVHRGVVVSVFPKYVMCARPESPHTFSRDLDDPRMNLDLTDATGRAHAAWWLAGQIDAEHPTHHAFRADRVVHTEYSSDGRPIGEEHAQGWVCEQRWFDASDDMFADLDPNDPRILPDGSRWVDAEALRRVCLHVAGLVP